MLCFLGSEVKAGMGESGSSLKGTSALGEWHGQESTHHPPLADPLLKPQVKKGNGFGACAEWPQGCSVSEGRRGAHCTEGTGASDPASALQFSGCEGTTLMGRRGD